MRITDFFKAKDIMDKIITRAKSTEKDVVDKLIDRLQCSDEDKRENALDVLSSMDLTVAEGIKVLEAAKKSYPKSKFDWKDISTDLIDICANRPYSEYVLKIDDIYDRLNAKAKNSALNFLAKYESEQAIITYLKLLEKDYEKMDRLPSGSLNKKPRNGDILFPGLLKFVDNKNITVDIYMILLTYFSNGVVRAEQIENSKAMIVKDIVEMSQRIMSFELQDSRSFWNNGEYLDLRYEAGVYFDLAGYINSPEVILALRNIMQVKDMRLKMFAAVSLIRLGKTISPEDALEIAADSEVRNWFYINLEKLEKEDIFPEQYRTQHAFAESNMVDWLIYPTELGRVPDYIELMNVFDNEEEEYYLFRFKCNNDEDGWLAGVSGPYEKDEIPTTSAGGYTFSHFEKWESKTPEEHLNAIVENISEYWMKRAEELEA
ncbi:hypothetical protein [Clostridium omnivorum]|uniref:HEAT repeat domain-containing protein n=1 Tax=Clostridium omnivorum TaxID=1604902 RepID=A0ABQ5N8S9_9CLOT|nr:hypothetical protein [Clostridium sp. E14]GLC31662.1 hypothetical protein bsdE14_30720 [Clostridium sp. E14]